MIKLGIILFTTAVVAALAEWTYREVEGRELDSLERMVIEAESGHAFLGRTYVRFGKECDTLQPSLREDFVAWVRREKELDSRLLDGMTGARRDFNSYAIVIFEFKGSGRNVQYGYLWSPRCRTWCLMRSTGL